MPTSDDWTTVQKMVANGTIQTGDLSGLQGGTAAGRYLIRGQSDQTHDSADLNENGRNVFRALAGQSITVGGKSYIVDPKARFEMGDITNRWFSEGIIVYDPTKPDDHLVLTWNFNDSSSPLTVAGYHYDPTKETT